MSYFEYKVKDSDTLWNIAEQFLKDGNRYHEIARLNNINANSLYVGQKIFIPGSNNRKDERRSAASSSETGSISVSEFNNAITSNGYHEQSHKYNAFINSLNYAGITSKREAAMYLAQLIHESGGLQTTRENYNPVSESHYGRYIGRGYIQLSSIENYKAAGGYLGVDYVNNPELVEKDPHAWNVSAWYWKTEVHEHVPSGFNATTERGIRPLQPHHDSRNKIYRNVCNAFNL